MILAEIKIADEGLYMSKATFLIIRHDEECFEFRYAFDNRGNGHYIVFKTL